MKGKGFKTGVKLGAKIGGDLGAGVAIGGVNAAARGIGKKM